MLEHSSEEEDNDDEKMEVDQDRKLFLSSLSLCHVASHRSLEGV